MAKIIIKTIDDLLKLEGEKLGVSNWIHVDQNMINGFADVTRDHQWIHVNPERAKIESPYNKTIAHGYLTLSLIPFFLDEMFEVRNLKQLVNYSIEKMVYKSAVLVDSKLRMVAYLDSAKDLGNICKAKIRCIFEIEGNDNPVLEGTIVFLYYFE